MAAWKIGRKGIHVKAILVAVDAFDVEHMQRIKAAAQGWASVERISQDAPPEVYKTALGTAEVVIGWPDAKQLALNPITYFQLPSVGYDAYLGKGLAGKPGFTLCNARGVMSVAVAEHALALMFTLTRRISEHVRDASNRRWERKDSYGELFGRTVCVVGLGDIGTEIAHRCQVLGMRVAGVRFTPSKAHPVAEEVFGLSNLKKAVSDADHVVNILPTTKGTEGLFTAEVFAAMPQGAYFYNLGRGGTVDEEALVGALRSGHLAGAGLDVFTEEPLPKEHPLWELNTVVTPHVAGRSVHEFDRMCELFVKNLKNLRQQKPLVNAVDLVT